MDDPNRLETEEDGIRAEALRRLKVRRLSQTQPALMPASSPSPNNTPETTESSSADSLNTPR